MDPGLLRRTGEGGVVEILQIFIKYCTAFLSLRHSDFKELGYFLVAFILHHRPLVLLLSTSEGQEICAPVYGVAHTCMNWGTNAGSFDVCMYI